MHLPRQIRYKGLTYVLADALPSLDMDAAISKVKLLLRDSAYAKERLDNSSPQRFDDDVDVASTILVNSIFHDVIFSEPPGNHAKFFSWLVRHYPKDETPAAVFDIAKGLRQHDPTTLRQIVKAVRPEALA